MHAHGTSRFAQRQLDAGGAYYAADAGLHFEGTGETAWGTRRVLVAVRSPDVHGRVIADIDWVAKPGGDAAVAMNSFVALAPHCPGVQGVLYDTALRGEPPRDR